MSALTWAWANRYLVIAIVAAALLGWKEHTINGLRADLDAKTADASAARTANEASRQSFDTLVRLNTLGYDAIAAAGAKARARDRRIAELKEAARHAETPPDACTTIGPRLGAVLDGLRRERTAADGNPDGDGHAAPAASDLRR